jgi:hypothetical protein
MRRIIFVLTVVAVMAAMVVAAGPVFAEPVNSCRSASRESQCRNTEPNFVLNYGACEAFRATTLGGQAVAGNNLGNPSIVDGFASACNPDVFPPPPG